MTAVADRHLLYGLIALQNGLINQGQLLAAFQEWTLDKSRSLADHLEARGDLTGAKRAILEALAGVHLEAHGGDVEQSLAAIPAARSTRDSLYRLADADILATLFRAGSSGRSTEPDPPVDSSLTTDYSMSMSPLDSRRFRIVRPHAQGGLGEVFVAIDCELNREVALKHILDRHADDPVSRQRFLIEAEITGGLEHPGIVPVYGLGTYADGRPYYAMRFIRGESLKEAIERFHGEPGRVSAGSRGEPGRVSAGSRGEPGRVSAGSGSEKTRGAHATPLALRRLLRRFIDVCNAIDYAHSRGVIHRDLKPANIILGRHGETLVVDWGLAKSLGRSGPADDSIERTLIPRSSSGSAVTLPGSAMGTPAYMSPEQAAGELDRQGARSDVYSLGATLYCILTGKAPFEGEVAEVLRKVQRGDFPPPRRLDPAIPEALDAVCQKAMATKPHDRYPSCRALADDVERWMADEPVAAWKEPLYVRARRWVSRNRTPVATAVAALLVAAAGLAVVLVLQSQANARLAELLVWEVKARERESDARHRADARFDLAVNAISALSTGVTQDVLLQRDEFKDLRNKLLMTAQDFYQKFFKEAAADPNLVQGRLKGIATAVRKVAQVQEMTGAYAEAEATYRQAIAIYEKAPTATMPSEIAQWYQHIADTLTARGKVEEALVEMERAVKLTGDPSPDKPPAANRYASFAWLYMGQLEWRLGRVDDALASLKKSLPPAEERAEQEGSFNQSAWIDLVGIYQSLGDVYRGIGRPAEGLIWHDKALATWERLLKLPMSPEAAGYSLESFRDAMLTEVGRDLSEAGRPAEGRPKLEAAVRGLEEIFTKRRGDPNVRRKLTSAHAAIAVLLAQSGDPALAARHADRVTELYQGFTPFIMDDHYTLAEAAAARWRLLGRGRAESAALDAQKSAALDAQKSAALDAQKSALTKEERAERDRLAAAVIGALNDAFALGFRCAPLLRSDPDFAPLRSLPAFQELTRRVEAAAHQVAASPHG